MPRMPRCANPIWTKWLEDHRDTFDKEKNRNRWASANKAWWAMLNHSTPLTNIDDARAIKNIGDKTVEILRKRAQQEREGVAAGTGSSRVGLSTSPKKRGRPRKDEGESSSDPRPAKRTVSESAIAQSRATASHATRPSQASALRPSNSLPLATSTSGASTTRDKMRFWYIGMSITTIFEALRLYLALATAGDKDNTRRRVYHYEDASVDAWTIDGECFGYIVEILSIERAQCAHVIKGIWDFDEDRVFGYLPMEMAAHYPTSTLPLESGRSPLSARSSFSSLRDTLVSMNTPPTRRDTTSTVSRAAASTSLRGQDSRQSVKGKEREPLFLADEDDGFGSPGSLLSQPSMASVSRTPSVSSRPREAPSAQSSSRALSRSRTMPAPVATTSARPTAGLTRSSTMASGSTSTSGTMGPPPLPSSSQRGGRTQFEAATQAVRRPGRARMSEHVPNFRANITDDSESAYNEIGNYIAFKSEHHFSVPNAPLKLRANAYDIILVLDNREKDGMKHKGIYDKLKQKSIRVTQRPLAIGDVAWIAKKKDTYMGDEQPDEVVLDAILERKRIDDLFASIKDGRFHEQKFRLHHSAITRVWYVVEAYEKAQNLVESYQQAFATAVSSTRCVDDFMVRETKSLQDTVNYYANLHWNLCDMYKNQDLLVLPDNQIKRYNYLEYQRYLQKMEPNQTYHITYNCFEQLNSKSGFTTSRTSWAKMLLTIHGLSPEKAGLLIEGFPTSKSLWRYFKQQEQREREELEEEIRNPPQGRSKKSKVVQAKHCLAHYKTGGRRFGEVLSEKVYEVLRTRY
ncbi:Crossover junction endonuclease mus81 [Marasmius crinis-equi]|uniref:Crossover junction endonuclease MUS81 n=1 Tax=Marasmius crinis-equi TaxID=585013 RepID=A0ABR3FML3_9AGAR